MSIPAINWAWAQRDLKPATKLILICLADCHNAHTKRCDPSQATLAEECGVSRSTLNLHLKELEAAGLIQRIQRADKQTRQQERTLYILGCDKEPAQNVEGAVSENRTRETGKKEGAKGAASGSENGNPVSENRTRKTSNPVSEKWQKPCPKNGKSRVRPIGHEPEENLKRTMRANKSTADAGDDVPSFWAGMIQSGGFVPSSAISARVASDMLQRNLVTAAQLKSIGVSV